jgi:hypothetical protein
MHEKLTFTAKAKLLDDYNYKKAFKAIAQSLDERGEFPEELVAQPDLLVIQSVILTTGRPGNLNDDVILNEHIMGVLDTAAFKPFNLEHDTGSIVGVMFDAFAVDKETGEVISVEMNFDETEDDDKDAKGTKNEKMALEAVKDLPERIDIINNAVVWALHFPNIAAELKNKAIQGEMFVSMEVFFTDFDFLVGNKIIRRTEETDRLLTPALRILGGSGIFQGEKVKRIPKNLTIGGIAATATPANPESFILDVKDNQDLQDEKALIREQEARKKDKKTSYNSIINSNVIRVLHTESKDDSTDTSHQNTPDGHGDQRGLGSDDEAVTDALVDMVVASNEENSMEKRIEELVAEKAELKTELKEAVSSLAEANKAVEELRTRTAELESELEEKLNAIKEKEEELASKAEAIEAFAAEKDELSNKLAETNAELEEIAKSRKIEERTAAVAELPISDERKASLVEENISLDDEAFAAKVADLEALVAELAANTTQETEVVDANTDADTDESDEDEGEAEETLENAEEIPVAAASVIASDADAGSDEEEEAEKEVELLQAAFAKTLLNK